MPTRSISFPTPVLGNQDDVLSSFDIVDGLQMTINHETIEIQGELVLDDIELRSLLLEDELVSLRALVGCPISLFEDAVELSPVERGNNVLSFQFQVPSSSVSRKLTLQVILISVESFTAYRLSTFHEDYGGAEFAIDPGQILAVTPIISIDLDEKFDPLAPSPSSFVELVLLPADDPRPMSLDADSDKLIIGISERLNRRLTTLPPAMLALYSRAAVIQPALVQVLSEYFTGAVSIDDIEDVAESRWYQSIATLLEMKSLEALPPVEQAAVILDDPSSRAVELLSTIFQGDENDD